MTQLTPEQLAGIVARDEIGSLHSTGPEIHTELVADRRALLSHIDALSLAERHAVREYAKWFEQCVQHEERIAALTAEIAALRRDAEMSNKRDAQRMAQISRLQETVELLKAGLPEREG